MGQDIRDPGKASVAFVSPSNILLPRSLRPCHWRHVPELNALVRDLHSDPASQGDNSQDVRAPGTHAVVLRAAQGPARGSGSALARGMGEDGVDAYEHYTHASPTLHLPHLLRALGPSSLYHVFGFRRILGEGPNTTPELKGKLKEGINILGIVTLHNIDMLERESRTNRGWILCMTDAIFLEKPQYHKLGPYARRPTSRFSTVRFTRSDVKQTELDRILQPDTDNNGAARAHHASAPFWTWTDACGVYEDIGSRDQWSWAGSPREQSVQRARARVHGDGIEGRRASYRLHDGVGNDNSDSSGDGRKTWTARCVRRTDARFVEWFAEYACGARISRSREPSIDDGIKPICNSHLVVNVRAVVEFQWSDSGSLL
ncbi:hypothetical protein EDB89DRAFT_2072611 [Lactarius sanguifluus]|nr:hypothetical protein EDB89DRAFT_2072611 [Lactarius sanguifluus]